MATIQDIQTGLETARKQAESLQQQVVNIKDLQGATTPTLPEKPKSNVDELLAMAMSSVPPTTPLPQVPPVAEPNKFKDLYYQKILGQEAPVSPAETRQKAETTYGVTEKQQKVSDLTAQLNAINAEAQASALKLVGQGRGIPQEVLQRQSTQIERERAIRALPIAAQLSAEQGNLNTAITLANRAVEEETNYKTQLADFRTKQLDAIYQIANEEEKKQIEQEQMRIAEQTAKDKTLNDFKKQMVDEVIKKGRTDLISEIIKAEDEVSIADVVSGIVDVPLTSGMMDSIQVLTSSGKPMNDTQATSFGYATRLSEADSIIDGIGNKFVGAKSYLGSILPNIFKSADRQRFEQAKRNFVNAVLRRESGAVISPSEFKNAEEQYFPQPGDTEEVLKQKNENRETVISNFYRQSGLSQRPATLTIQTPDDFRSKYNY